MTNGHLVKIAFDTMKWPVRKELHAHMKQRQAENLALCVANPNENWMLEKLKATGLKWKRQSQWGFRLFDFWNHVKGVAVEVDGKSHNTAKDSDSDEAFYKRSGIIVLRVRNKNEADAEKALAIIPTLNNWKQRRVEMGIEKAPASAVERLGS